MDLFTGAYSAPGNGKGKGSISAEKAVKCVVVQATPSSKELLLIPFVDQFPSVNVATWKEPNQIRTGLTHFMSC